eukprot:UN33167
MDICRPEWIESPELFYGFWGDCTNMYRDCKPNKGYNILNKWKKRVISKCKYRTEFASCVKYNTDIVKSSIAEFLIITLKTFIKIKPNKKCTDPELFI